MFVKKISFAPSPQQIKELDKVKKRYNVSQLLREALDKVIENIKGGAINGSK